MATGSLFFFLVRVGLFNLNVYAAVIYFWVSLPSETAFLSITFETFGITTSLVDFSLGFSCMLSSSSEEWSNC
jgi:hypothetical protein